MRNWLLATVLLVAGAAECEVLRTVNDRLLKEFLSSEGLLLDYVGEIPTPEEIADLKPNAMGWWCPIENGSMFTGEWLPALMAEGESRKPAVERCVRGLIKMSEVSDVPGFIARGTGTDGKSHHPCGSNDQTDPWFFGLCEYCRWPHADAALKAKVLERLTFVARALEANGWGVPCDGPFKGQNRGNLNARTMPFWGKTRLLYSLKSLHRLTGDARWAKAYDEIKASALDAIEAGGAVDEKAFRSCYTGGIWIYVSSAEALARLIEMEENPDDRARMRKGFLRFAERCAPLMKTRMKYANTTERPFKYANWRTGYAWRVQKTQKDAEAVAYSGKKEILGTRKDYERHGMANPLAAAAVCALQGDARFRNEIVATLRHYDYSTPNVSEFFHAAIAAAALRTGASGEVHRGVTLGFYAPAGYYGSQEARDEVDRIAAAGATWIVLTPNVWQEGRYTTVQFNDFMKSQSDLDVLDLCDYIHAKGLRVALRPVLECFDGTDRTYVDFENDVNRLDPRQGSSGNTYCSRWFASMKARAVRYATVAERCRCEAFYVDTTRDRMSGAAFNAYWTDILKDVRRVYRGLVTCGRDKPRSPGDFASDKAPADFWQNGLDRLVLDEEAASVRPEWLAPDGTAEVRTNGVFVDVAHLDVASQLADLRRRGLVRTDDKPTSSTVAFRPARVTPPIGKETALDGIHHGMSIGLRVPFGYFSSDEAKRDVDAMAEMGVDWVVLCITVWQEGRYSPLQFADYGRTPGEIEILDICDYIHSKGLHVTLRPMEEAYDGTDRMYIDFENDVFRCPPIAGSVGNTYCSRWFRSVKARSVWYARVAERCRCEAFCIDSEMDRMADYAFNAYWKDILSEVRKVYTGALTSCHTRNPRHGVKWDACLPHKDFWLYDLDYLQISDYRRPVDDYEEREHSLEEMQKGFETEWLPYFRDLAKRYGKPIQFGEFGCTSSKAGARSPATESHLGYDGEEQARFLEAFMRVFSKEDWCRGFYWWSWKPSITPESRASREKDGPDMGFGPYGKPVEDVFRKWYGEPRRNEQGRSGRVLMIGDSITEQGICVQGSGTYHQLTNVAVEVGADVTFVGLGFSGSHVDDWEAWEKKSRTEDVWQYAHVPGRRNLKDEFAKGADVIVFFLGQNDITRPLMTDEPASMDAWVERCRRLIVRLKERTKARDVVLGTITACGTDPESARNRGRRALNDRLRALAAREGWRVADYGAVIDRLQRRTQRGWRFNLVGDYVHPSFKTIGHTAIAAELCRALGERRMTAALEARLAREIEANDFREKPCLSANLTADPDRRADKDEFDWTVDWRWTDARATPPERRRTPQVEVTLPDGFRIVSASDFHASAGTFVVRGKPVRLSQKIELAATYEGGRDTFHLPIHAPWRVLGGLDGTDRWDAKGYRKDAPSSAADLAAAAGRWDEAGRPWSVFLSTPDYCGLWHAGNINAEQFTFGTGTDAFYAARRIRSAKRRTVKAFFSHDTWHAVLGLRVWLNGREVFSDFMGGATKKLPIPDLTLEAGDNLLVIRADHRQGQRQFALDFEAISGDSLDDLRIGWK